MTREEMLKKLHSIGVGAQATVGTMDGLQYEYVTSEGWGEEFGIIYWPVYVLHGISDELLTTIKDKILCGTLSPDDLSGTDLKKFYNYIHSIERPQDCEPSICELFEGITQIKALTDGTLYILCDSPDWKPEALFFDSYDCMAKAFIDQYSYDIQAWEDLDDDELACWIERIDKELNKVDQIEFYPDDGY